MNEFLEMVRRHGKTPIQFAAGLGLLGPTTIVGHGIFIDEHSWTNWHSASGPAPDRAPGSAYRQQRGLPEAKM